jgi:hypothetical protein
VVLTGTLLDDTVGESADVGVFEGVGDVYFVVVRVRFFGVCGAEGFAEDEAVFAGSLDDCDAGIVFCRWFGWSGL